MTTDELKERLSTALFADNKGRSFIVDINRTSTLKDGTKVFYEGAGSMRVYTEDYLTNLLTNGASKGNYVTVKTLEHEKQILLIPDEPDAENLESPPQD